MSGRRNVRGGAGRGSRGNNNNNRGNGRGRGRGTAVHGGRGRSADRVGQPAGPPAVNDNRRGDGASPANRRISREELIRIAEPRKF